MYVCSINCINAQSTTYSSLITEAAFSSKSINLSLPVGNLAGAASVSGGFASYAVPIIVPPGTNGVAPSISVAYNSSGGDGQLGKGWEVIRWR
jgi:Salmonella virulence plasmid 65kDa B protein